MSFILSGELRPSESRTGLDTTVLVILLIDILTGASRVFALESRRELATDFIGFC